MNTRTKQVAASGAAIGVVAVILGTVWAFGATAGTANPEPTATVSVTPADFREFQTDVQEVIDAQVARVEAERVEAERVAAEAQAAADEAARVAAEQADAAAQEASRQAANRSAPEAPAAPAEPVRCPAGSTANSSDGVNDTSCFPEECQFAVEGPPRPQCDTAFRP
ncbi:hypothetical protein [Microbacterium sp. BR1]|uniref:hypothetical protein n=1 Tax=Microbacterium sp. BR1 TaxID=1070896 RepID=UPI0012FDF4A5|nr:hypothetical protein [Microbacterium sp. BR1]